MKSYLIACLCLGPTLGHADTLDHLGTFAWQTDTVVGLSGLEVADNGQDFTAISDLGWLVRGRFQRENDTISDLTDLTIDPIRGIDGNPVTARRVGDWADAEGLAIAPDGTTWIAFERWAHVSVHATADAAGTYIPDHPDFARFADNRQLEALAHHPDGTIFALTEDTLGGAFPIFRLTDRTWDIVATLPQRDGFAIVGADFAPSGQLYVLERKHVFGRFLQSRVRQVTLDPTLREDILWTSRRDAFGNLEGIAFWTDDQGPRLTMVSDNNADGAIPTQFVDFRIVP